MGCASRFIMLLTTPFPFLLHRPSLLRLARRSRLPSSQYLAHFATSSHYVTPSPASRPQLGFPAKAIHTQTSTNKEDSDSLGISPNSPAAHPWPEWSSFIDSLSSSGYFDHQGREILVEDEFVAYEELSDDFVRASSACLFFARDRSDLLGLLSRRDIGVVVENGTAFLFKSALDTARRMRAFIGTGAGNEFDSNKAHTVDLMKYLLSYASNPTLSSERSNLRTRELIESAVRNLLSEVTRLGCGVPSAESSASVQHQFADWYGQTPRHLEQNTEMKRGDWICHRCAFMNFARNIKCLKCEEARPKRLLTGGEWECPQCDFFNYGRNLVCLRCDCKRPGDASFGITSSSSGLGHGNKPDIESRLAANEEKAQRWFTKVSQPESASDLSNAAADEDFPEIMPMREGVDRFNVSTRKTPLEQRLANSQFQRDAANTGSSEIVGRTSAVSDGDKNSGANGQNAGTASSPSLSRSTSPQSGHPKGSHSSYVPFVPLPKDMFAKNLEKSKENEMVEKESIHFASSKASEQTNAVSVSSQTGKSADSLHSPEKPSNEVEKSESWFKKVADLHDATDLESEISDDFQEIMPMRKGDSRFVVSKKKDRSLTSPIYKRRMAMEQTSGTTNFVPFVPFPPGYFAKKDNQQLHGGDSTVKAADEISSDSDINNVRKMDNPQTSTGGLNLKSSGENLNERMTSDTYGSPISGNLKQNSFDSQSNHNERNSAKESRIESTDLTGSSTKQPESQSARTGWTGKSLEGSAVQEPDPLDMSEEAKAQRWFRRVAQIKDISELSQIPDEDFPSIMPMRKGVNRFVVSKRKTPLERRLTSTQYRKNLPVVSSDPPKKENEKS